MMNARLQPRPEITSFDLLPWADPYIAALVAEAQADERDENPA
jgi:hypothetical protein